MPNTQYESYSAGDWSGEISPPQPAAGGAPVASEAPAAHAHTTTSTTTTTTTTASAEAPASGGTPTAATVTNSDSGVPAARNEFEGSTGTLDLETHQPIEVIESPASMNEAFLGSLKSMLLRNRGNFITATFLIGTQGTTNWEGILHEVGNDYLVIFQPGRQRYIACDIYALKYIEFYDTQQREMCQQLLRENGLL